MTVAPTGAGLVSPRLLADLTGLLVTVTGEDERWAGRITPASRLEGDLQVESVELTALGAALADHYGDHVDLPQFLAGLNIDQLIGLTVGDLVGYVAACQAALAARTRP